MSNTFKVNNRAEFVNSFLNSISKVVEDCIVKIKKEKVVCLSATSDGTLVQLIQLKCKNDFEQTLNIPDIKRLHKIIGCINDESIELSVDTNSISYNSSDTKFKFYLLDDGILSETAISIEKIKKIEYDCEFDLTHDRINDLIKGSTFSNESEKLYLYTNENNCLYGELTDKEKPNMDSFSIKLCDNIKTKLLPIAFNFENIRIISSTRGNNVKFKINTQLNVMRVDIANGNCYISYIISGLVK